MNTRPARERSWATTLPDYTAESFRPYAPIMREIFAVLAADYRGQTAIALPPKSQEDLEWSRLLERLAHYCQSDEARAAALRLPVLHHRESVERRLFEAEEAVRLLTEDEAPPLRGLTSIGPFLAHAARDGVLDGEQLLAVGRAARTAEQAKTWFTHRRHLAPLLAHVADDLQAAPEVASVIEHAFDAAGRLVDSASPELGSLRRRVIGCQERIKRKVDEYLKSHDFQSWLQDDFFTVRQDRYVLPIRSGARGNVPGIVHGTSGSGQTVYIEPTEFVELNNELRLAQLEVEEEERRILRRLTGLVAKARGKLEANIDLLAYLDLTTAQAHLALELDAYRPTLAREPVLDLVQVRHPMLVLRARQAEQPFVVVPNDIRVGQKDDAGRHRTVLIVSGPNTGGKTVTLKTIGLCSLMARAGLLIPAAPGSVVPLYNGIFTDVGDEQSIERDLSTFSGHVANINSFIGRVDAGSIVLLDELFAGTDPAQGAALAVALLEYLQGRGATVIVTTHLDGVKTVAFDRPGFLNGAVGFDVSRLQPTYELTLGLPGSSYAVRIARKLGLPEPVLRRAEELDEGAGRADIERVLRELETQRELLAIERNRARDLQSEAVKQRSDYERRLRELKARNQTWIDEEARATLDALRKAHETVRQKIAELQAANDPRTITHARLDEAREELNRVRKAVEPVLSEPEVNAPEERFRLGEKTIEEGRELWVRTFKRQGKVLEVQRDKQRAIVQVGAVRATVGFADLFTLTEGEEQRLATRRAAKARASAADDALQDDQGRRVIPPPYGENTLDLRGMTADDAIERVEMFLDRAYHDNEPGGYIIHGHGTGVLKRAIRELLPKFSFVHSFRAGEHGEGGDGVTVVYLR